MKYLREIITTVITVVIIASGLLVRSLNLSVNNLDLLIGAFYGGLPFLIWGGWSNRIRKLIGKPKLEFDAQIKEDTFKQKKDDKEESTRLTFWVHVRNSGNEVAENCKVRLKITDQTGSKQIVEKTTYPNVDEDILVHWQVGGNKEEVRDIPISKYFDSAFKIPFVMEYYPEDESKDFINKPMASMYFEDPIQKAHKFSFVTPINDSELVMGFLIEAVFLSNFGIITSKKFKLSINISSVVFVPIDDSD